MAIIYSYQENNELMNSDMLVGTATTLYDGKVRKVTKNFTLGELKTFIHGGDLILTNGGTSGPATLVDNILNIPVYQGAITLTTTGTSGAATLIGNTLNIPNYAASTPTLQSVTTAGNTTTLDIFANTFQTNSGYGLLDDGTVIGESFQFPSTLSYLNYLGAGFNTWDLPDNSGTIALTSDIPVYSTPTLQQVLSAGHDLVNGNNFQGTDAGSSNTGVYINAFGETAVSHNTGNYINAFGSNAANTNSGTGINAFGVSAAAHNSADNVNAFGGSAGLNNTYSNVNLFGVSATADENGQVVFSKNGTILARLSTALLTATRKYSLPDASGTLALTSDIPSALTLTTTGSSGPATLVGSTLNVPDYSSGTPPGIQHGTASGTDTYAVTIAGIAAYTDGDAYLIRFTNANTTTSTLNINGLGAVPLYRNNDGQVLGGDIWADGEMLCVYNSGSNIFQCIGVSPNSLFAYVTNADTVPITKGMPVYASGGTGDRMRVKRAYNTSDTTSAQTVGVVLTSSIGVNQKGIIIVQGLLDGLNILPTSTWADGDPVYLASTAGDITNVKQYAPNHLVYLGVVTTASNGSAGRWYVRVQNGYELDELHNVSAQSPSNYDGIFYNTSTLLWEKKNVSQVLPERRNANNSTNNNINYCGTADKGSTDASAVWTIERLTIGSSGSVTIGTATNVAWTNRESVIYT